MIKNWFGRFCRLLEKNEEKKKKGRENDKCSKSVMMLFSTTGKIETMLQNIAKRKFYASRYGCFFGKENIWLIL